MSSNIQRRYRNTTDVEMIDRVLSNAGLEGTVAAVHSDARGDAARFLVNKFESGIRTEIELSEALRLYVRGLRL